MKLIVIAVVSFAIATEAAPVVLGIFSELGDKFGTEIGSGTGKAVGTGLKYGIKGAEAVGGHAIDTGLKLFDFGTRAVAGGGLGLMKGFKDGLGLKKEHGERRNDIYDYHGYPSPGVDPYNPRRPYSPSRNVPGDHQPRIPHDARYDARHDARYDALHDARYDARHDARHDARRDADDARYSDHDQLHHSRRILKPTE